MPMKYELTLMIRSSDGDKFDMEKIKADDLLHLASQFTILLLQTQRKEHEAKLDELSLLHEDDIPF